MGVDNYYSLLYNTQNLKFKPVIEKSKLAS